MLSEQSAQKQSIDIAKSAFGPKLGAFASWETDSRSLGWKGGNNWTAGLELQIDLFSGGAKQAELRREKARMEQVEAFRRGLEDRVRLEVRRAYYDHDSARQQLAVSKAAADQATESLRILSNRYESGLASVTDLLRAEEAVHKTKVDYWEALAQTQTSYSQLELATGQLTIDSPVVMQ
jgi:outer membrane protein TolC